MTKASTVGKKKKRVTLSDVAKDAGVSRATASLVVRDSPLIKPETKARVVASIERLGYVYNRAAASMRSQRSSTIGLIITDITNPFFAEFTVGMEAYLEEKQYAVIMSNTSEKVAKQARLLNTMREYHADGVLLCPANNTPRADIEKLRDAQYPVVLVARYLYDVDVDYIGIDNVYGASVAVKHLVAQGHSRIAFVGGPENSSARKDRLAGYKAGLDASGIQFDTNLTIRTKVSRDGGFAAVQKLLSLKNPPTAALCYNDIVAFGVLAGLNSAGVEIGDEFGVVGFDDLADSPFQSPPLTTLAVPTNELGERAAQMLLERVENPLLPAQRIVLRPELIVRNSSMYLM